MVSKNKMKDESGNKQNEGDGKGQLCHQCRGSKRVVHCLREKCSKCYCFQCIEKWYPRLTEKEVAERCPFCQGNCNCKVYLRRAKVPNISGYNGVPENSQKKIRYLKYLICVLSPILKDIHNDQLLQKDMEAKIREISPTDLEIQQAKFYKDERVYCNNCGTSIFDLHQSSPSCSNDICPYCCLEIREGCLKGGDHLILHSNQLGVPNSIVAGKNGGIRCAPKEMGCCGNDILVLKCMFPDGLVSKLHTKVEELVDSYAFVYIYTVSGDQCPCFDINREVDIVDTNICKAACRKDFYDSYIYDPSSSDIQQGVELDYFHRHWGMGEPAIVRDVLQFTNGLSWEPMVMYDVLQFTNGLSREPMVMCDVLQFTNGLIWEPMVMCDVLQFTNGLSWEPMVMCYVLQFTNGLSWEPMVMWDVLQFTNGLSWETMVMWRAFRLKLVNWPPENLSAERLPRHGAEFIRTLPYLEYTHPRSGVFSLAAKLPYNVLKPDHGPKICIAYEFHQELGRGDSVTKLHRNMADAVYVLTHTTELKAEAEVNNSSYNLSRIEALQKKHAAVEQNLEESNGKTKSEPGEGEGAVWDIFQRQDVRKQQEYLWKDHEEFRHINPVEQGGIVPMLVCSVGRDNVVAPQGIFPVEGEVEDDDLIDDWWDEGDEDGGGIGGGDDFGGGEEGGGGDDDDDDEGDNDDDDEDDDDDDDEEDDEEVVEEVENEHEASGGDYFLWGGDEPDFNPEDQFVDDDDGDHEYDILDYGKAPGHIRIMLNPKLCGSKKDQGRKIGSVWSISSLSIQQICETLHLEWAKYTGRSPRRITDLYGTWPGYQVIFWSEHNGEWSHISCRSDFDIVTFAMTLSVVEVRPPQFYVTNIYSPFHHHQYMVRRDGWIPIVLREPERDDIIISEIEMIMFDNEAEFVSALQKYYRYIHGVKEITEFTYYNAAITRVNVWPDFALLYLDADGVALIEGLEWREFQHGVASIIAYWDDYEYPDLGFFDPPEFFRDDF